MIGTERIVSWGLLALAVTSGCTTAPPSREGKDALIRQAAATLSDWNGSLPGVEGFARRSYGYVMFPEVTKGGLGLGAAYGRGVVYEQGEHIGYADLSQASLGLQAGGQVYQVLVVFDNQAAIERFKRGELNFSADGSGVLFTAGYAASIRFHEGMTVFAKPLGGIMGEASLGGQRFTFVPRDDG